MGGTADAGVWLDLTTNFVAANGRLSMRTDVWDGYKVGRWVNTQRTAYRKGHLSQSVVSACASIPGWTWKERARRSYIIPFATGLDMLKKFVAAHGRLPRRREVGDAPQVMHLWYLD